VLARAIYAEGCKAVAAGLNPLDLRRGIQMAVNKVVETLEEISRPINSKEEISQVRIVHALVKNVRPILLMLVTSVD
jgi:chaperonin GroEL